MKPLCCSKLLLTFLLLCSSVFAALHDKSAIVYYGKNISYPMVGIHNYIIVEPENINTYTHGFDVYKNKMYAYVSIGEVDKNSFAYKNIDKSWIKGKNGLWNSTVLDVTNPAYQTFLFDKIIEPEIKLGFKNFFFDTLDSYKLVSKTAQEKEAAKKALIHIIKTFHSRYPQAKLIINRGFGIIDAVHNDITAVLFESYYHGVGGKELQYKDVSQSDRKWLNPYLQKIKKYKLDIIAVEYLPQDKMTQAKKLVTKLQKQGFIPYVAQKELDTYGVSSKNAQKREIMFLIDESTKDRIDSDAHVVGSLPIEYQGYIPRFYDVSKGLPSYKKVANRYAGVIIWLDKGYKNPKKLVNWVKNLATQKEYVVFADSFWMDLSPNLFKPLGLNVYDANQRKHAKVIEKSKLMDFELKATTLVNTYVSGKAITKPLYSLEDKDGVKTTLAALTTWGGYALGGAFNITMQEDTMWSINPFEFYKEALHLKPLLIPDPTTQNGKRVFFTHIDGDAFMNRVAWDPKLFCTQTLYKEVFTHYKVPQSISIIGGEIGPHGLYPKLSAQLIEIAKKIYAIPYVEGASHTYSHPFDWMKIDANNNLSPKYRLPIKGYKFCLKREISGNMHFINDVLMPKNKPKKLLAKTIFWSGNCNPPYKILDRVYRDGYLNMNGGDTTIINQDPWLSRIAPYGLTRKNYQQIYTGEQDENIYTDEWKKNFWGFKNVVQTYRLTNSPKRFKPIDIYYHFYTGSKRASINAIKYVFDWVIKQNVIPMFTSEYIPKAMDFYSISMANEGNHWFVAGMNSLKTLRINDKKLFIDFKHSKGVLGESDFEVQRYFHLFGDQNYITLTKKKPIHAPYIIESNGFIKSYKKSAKQLHYHIKSYVKLKVDLNVPRGCKVHTSGNPFVKKWHSKVSLLFKIKEVDIDVKCK
jgi:hypothetical protein